MARGNISFDQIRDADRQGDGPYIQMAKWTGSPLSAPVSGNVPMYDSAGNLVDSGSAPGGSGSGSGVPWLRIVDPTTVSFSWRNQGGASETVHSGDSLYLLAPAGAGNNIRGREISAPSTPWSITTGFIPQCQSVNFANAGMYVSDGTKLTVFKLQAGFTLLIQNFTNVTTFSATAFNVNALVWITPMFFRVTCDSTNLTFYWSPNGRDFIQLYQTAKTAFLSAVSYVGYMAESANASVDAGNLLVSWLQT
jgi:hypothetical protein